MGLAGWPQLEAMEDQSFHLLHARTPQLIMTRPLYQDQSQQVRSRFIERLHESRPYRSLENFRRRSSSCTKTFSKKKPKNIWM